MLVKLRSILLSSPKVTTSSIHPPVTHSALGVLYLELGTRWLAYAAYRLMRALAESGAERFGHR
jgi:hypothetical protein